MPTTTTPEIIERFRPVYGNEKTDAHLLLYQMNLEKGTERRLDTYWAMKHRHQFGFLADDQRNVLLNPPSPDQSHGEYHLGWTRHGKKIFAEFGLRKDELIQHTLVVGRSGAGKTNTMLNLVGRFLQKGDPFLIFDMKQTYRSLTRTREGQKMLIWTIGDGDTSPFYWNPLIPMPGVSPMDTMKDNILALASGHYLGHGVFKILKDAIMQAYRDYGIVVENQIGPASYERVKSWPTWSSILQNIYDLPSSARKSQWMDSAIRAVEWMNLPGMGDAVNVPYEVPVEKLLFSQSVMEMYHLAFWDQKYFTEALTRAIRRYLMSQKYEHERLRLNLIYEEAHNWFMRESKDSAATMTDDFNLKFLREIREMGVGIHMVTQSPYLFAVTATENTITTLVHNLKGIQSIDSASAMLGLRGQKKDLLLRLKTGEALCTVQNRHPFPFLIEIPLANISKGYLDDEYVKGYMYERGLEMRKELGIDAPHQRSLEMEDEKLEQEAFASSKDDEKTIVLPDKRLVKVGDAELRLLRDTNQHISGMRERYKRMAFSVSVGNKAKSLLLTKGLIEELKIPTRQGSTKILTLTSKGKQALEKLGDNIIKTKRWGSVEHRYACMELARYCEQFGYSALVENPIGKGKEIDVYLEKQEKADSCPEHPMLGRAEKVSLEYETGSSDLTYNIQKGLDAGCDLVVSIGRSARVKEKIWNDASIAGLNNHPKVRIVTLREFYKTSPEKAETQLKHEEGKAEGEAT